MLLKVDQGFHRLEGVPLLRHAMSPYFAEPNDRARVTTGKALKDEAFYFFKQLADETGGSIEKSEFLLSAFLGAARTVETRALHIYKAAFKSFRADWAKRYPNDELVAKQMTDDRNLEIHERDSWHVEADHCNCRSRSASHIEANREALPRLARRAALPRKCASGAYAFRSTDRTCLSSSGARTFSGSWPA